MINSKLQKRALAIHDISCVGRCSLTVALPILSVSGIETSILPTSILSTHTGGFKGFTFRDLTDDILNIVEHWKTLTLTFDSIYTGYLGSIKQLDKIEVLFKQLKNEETLIFIDPVMGDHGKLYKNFPQEFPQKMAHFCQNADIITPNMTEAFLILEEPYQDGPYTSNFITSILKKLSELGPKCVILTGVWFNENEIGVAAFDRDLNEVIYQFSPKINAICHGTGDIFASTVLSALLNDKPLAEALKIAVEFTVNSIKRTLQVKSDLRYGVNFEQSLPELGQKFI